MGEIVNLRRERKRRARDAASRDAAANRALHGATPAERTTLQLDRERSRAVLDGAKLEGPEQEEAPQRCPGPAGD